MRTEIQLLDEAAELIEKANANLQPELVTSDYARKLMQAYARIEKLGGFGVAALSRKLQDPSEVAKVAGTSMGKAKAVVTTGKVMKDSPDLEQAMTTGSVSLDQAAEIASAEQSAPGAAKELLQVASEHSFHVLRDTARATKLEAEQHKDLARRQHRSRSGRSYTDGLGMVNIHLTLEPHVGTPIVARAEAEAQRIAAAAKKELKTGVSENGSRSQESGELEPFERYLADAYANLLSGGTSKRSRRPELVVLVSHEVAARGWKDVRADEVCKIPGVGPIAPRDAKSIAQEAFLNAVVCDGKDLREFKRFGRHIPVEVEIALELGEPPAFEGVVCVDCGKRFRPQFDHVQPVGDGGPTSHLNLEPRCWDCHEAKTKRDLEAMRAKRKRGGREKTGSEGGRERRRAQREGSARAGPAP